MGIRGFIIVVRGWLTNHMLYNEIKYLFLSLTLPFVVWNTRCKGNCDNKPDIKRGSFAFAIQWTVSPSVSNRNFGGTTSWPSRAGARPRPRPRGKTNKQTSGNMVRAACIWRKCSLHSTSRGLEEKQTLDPIPSKPARGCRSRFKL